MASQWAPEPERSTANVASPERGVPIIAERLARFDRLNEAAGIPGAGFGPGAERSMIRSMTGTHIDVSATVDRARDWLLTMGEQQIWVNELPAMVCALGTGLAAVGEEHASHRAWSVATDMPTSALALRAWIATCRARSCYAQWRTVSARGYLKEAVAIARRTPTSVGAHTCARASLAALLAGDDQVARWWATRPVLEGPEPAFARLNVIAALLDLRASNVGQSADQVISAAMKGLDLPSADPGTFHGNSGDRRAWHDLPDDPAEAVLLYAEVLMRAGEPEQACEVLTASPLPGSMLLRPPWLKLLYAASRDSGTKDVAAWARAERVRLNAQRMGARRAALRRDAQIAGVGLFDAMTDVVTQHWHQHAAGLSALVDHDLRGPTQTAALALAVLRSRMVGDRLVDDALSMLTAALDGVVRVSGALPLLAADRVRQNHFGVEIGGAEQDFEECDDRTVAVGANLEELVSALRVRLSGANQQLSVEVIDVDGLRWSRETTVGVAVILDNLIRNASAASADGSQVVVRMRRGSGHPAVVELEVVDQGEGFDPADATEIFRRGVSSRSQSRSGGVRGLGLFTVAMVVARLGGSISAESRAEGGATFRVQLSARSDDD